MASSLIYDPLRREWVARTPEEEVRQGVVAWLHEKMGVSLQRMESEYEFKYNGLSYRADILVFDRSLNPVVLVECKAPSVKLDAAVSEQVVRYARVLPVEYIIVTNGVSFHLLRRDPVGGGYTFEASLPGSF